MTEWAVQEFGATLTTKDGEKDTATALAGKDYIGIYFSAHWCPPCRGFTPVLSTFYSSHAADKSLEIVFVSSDRDQSAFDDYWGEMPWVALPYSDRARKGELCEKYGVRGIPSFVLLDKDGNIITKDGRSKVSGDAGAAQFPWR